ncbi:MAG: hypothetical protein A4E73_00254 [Syntrophaceae bacterium PtaU1.Bin231]|nr:MAG: hypothetical protein A4E73_00254 [Syntrophaceae bacterium PtaU1.Bin231]
MPLIFAPESGEAIVGSERISFVPVGDDGSVRVSGPSGSIIRPLRFGERTRLLVDALQADDPPVFCSDLLVHAATNAPADTLSTGGKALALLLAGGNIDAPSLSRTVAVVAEATGWPQEIINAKTAIEIDRMAFDLTPQNPGWNRIVFPRQGAVDADAIIAELATGLLNRTDEDMIRLVEDGFFQTADIGESERALRIRGGKSQPAPADSLPDESPVFPQGPAEFPSTQFTGFSRMPAAHPGKSASRSLIDGKVSSPDQAPAPEIFPPLPLAEDRHAPNGDSPKSRKGPLSIRSSSAPPSDRQSRQSVDSPDLTSQRNREPFEANGPSGRSERENSGGFVEESRKGESSPAEKTNSEQRISSERARNSKLDVQQPDRRGFAPPEAGFRTEGALTTGVLDRNPLQRTDFEPVPKENGLNPECRSLSRSAPPASGNQTGKGREQERRPDGNSDDRERYASLATERFSPSMGSQEILKMPVAGSAPFSFHAEANRDWGKDLLSSLDDLDLAALADAIGRLLAAEADLRGID